MESKTSKQNLQQDIEQLPEQLRQWCLAGKSLSDTAHLVKNIIQMVSGSAEIIELGMNKKQYDRVQKSWDLFEPNLKRLHKYVLDLIKFTRQYPIDKSTCDFNPVVRRSVQRCENLLKQRSTKITLSEDKTIPALSVDPLRIQEMVENLIIHAHENLGDTDGTICIETKHLKDHHQVQVSICDDGPALTEDVIRSLGEPTERSQNIYCTGFEIPLAGIVIEQHDGYLEFESTPDKGNVVHVYLPIK